MRRAIARPRRKQNFFVNHIHRVDINGDSAEDMPRYTSLESISRLTCAERTHFFGWPLVKFNLNVSMWLAIQLRPDAAAELHELYLAKGIMATAAIEGNTLSEEEVERRIKGDLKLPPSKEYLGTEIDNILEACNLILQEVVRDGVTGVSAEDLWRYNGLVLKGLKVDEDVVPGEVRRHSVGVGRYRGAPAEDCEYLLERLCQWLSGSDFEAPKGLNLPSISFPCFP